MNHATSILFAAALTTSLTSSLSAQGADFLYSTSQNETTASGSGGTVLQTIYPNEIVGLQSVPCPSRVEKWAPRSAFTTMAGDADGDDSYFEASLNGQIDALLIARNTAVGMTNAREIYFSPSATMANTISGANILRPGDIGRIVRNGSGDGQVERFITAELIQQALGMPISPIVIDVDAAAWMSPNMGLFLSLDGDHICAPCGGPTVLQDGAVFAIPPTDYFMTGGVITAVAPGSAVVVYTEAMMDTFVAGASVADRFGGLVPNAGDVEALEFDRTPGTTTTFIPGCYGSVLAVPRLIFTTETCTGGAVLTTAGGGSIYNSTCWPLGTNFGWGPTFGPQVGLQATSTTVGMPSHIDALAGNTRIFEFAAEAQVPQIPVFTPAVIDFVTPTVPFTWVFMTFAPPGPSAVAASSPFVWGLVGHPDYYAAPNFMGLIATGTGFGSYTSPAIPWATDMVFQGFTLVGTNFEASTPTMVEVF